MRGLSLFHALLLVLGTSAQEKVCEVPRERYVIIPVESIQEYGPYFEGEAALLTRADIERAECILERFISWHNGLARATRDSLMDATVSRIRAQCMTQEWRHYNRQYAGERTMEGALLVHAGFMHGEGLDPRTGRAWMYVNDGGDNYFTATVDLRRQEVIQYAVNGPYPPGGWCP